MAYSIYWEEEVHICPRGEIVVGDDGEKKRVLYRKHFLKFNYIPMSQIACISHGNGKLCIELKDGSIWIKNQQDKNPVRFLILLSGICSWLSCVGCSEPSDGKDHKSEYQRNYSNGRHFWI